MSDDYSDIFDYETINKKNDTVYIYCLYTSLISFTIALISGMIVYGIVYPLSHDSSDDVIYDITSGMICVMVIIIILSILHIIDLIVTGWQFRELSKHILYLYFSIAVVIVIGLPIFAIISYYSDLLPIMYVSTISLTAIIFDCIICAIFGSMFIGLLLVGGFITCSCLSITSELIRIYF